MTTYQPTKDYRPAGCRFRLQDEGKPYPKSSCTACGKSVGTGLGKDCTAYTPPSTPARPPFTPDQYGIVNVGNAIAVWGKPCVYVEINARANATELREAAHLFNQLAEMLEPSPVKPAPSTDSPLVQALNASIADNHTAAVRLLSALSERLYPGDPVTPLPTVQGVIGQIDHITATHTMRRRCTDGSTFTSWARMDGKIQAGQITANYEPGLLPTVEQRLTRLENRIGKLEKWKDNRHAR